LFFVGLATTEFEGESLVGDQNSSPDCGRSNIELGGCFGDSGGILLVPGFFVTAFAGRLETARVLFLSSSDRGKSKIKLSVFLTLAFFGDGCPSFLFPTVNFSVLGFADGRAAAGFGPCSPPDSGKLNIEPSDFFFTDGAVLKFAGTPFAAEGFADLIGATLFDASSSSDRGKSKISGSGLLADGRTSLAD
jgi:hypothetical protein